MKEFYKNAGIVINKIIEYVPEFYRTANYDTIVKYNNPRNSRYFKNNITKVLETYAGKIPTDDTKFNDAMLKVFMQKDFILKPAEYKEFSSDFVLYCLTGGEED